MKFRLSIALSILAITLSVANAETPPTPIPDDLDPCFAFTDDATYVNHTIHKQLENRDIHMRVPIDYFEDRWDRKDGFRDTAQLFSVEIGSFKMVSRPETAARKEKGIRSLLLVLVGDSISMENLAPLHAELFVRGGNLDRSLSDYQRMDGPFDLQEIRSPSQQSKHKLDKNIYLDFDDSGKLTTVLDCHAPGTLMNPGCEHFFEASGLDVSMTYDLTELPNWQRLQADVTHFLICATSPEL